MATSATTTLRVPAELRDEIARLAQARGTTMLRVVADAVHRLSGDEWWSTVHRSLDALSEAEAKAHRAEADGLATASPDGLTGG